MEELRIAFLGFGSANRALARMLLEKSEPSPDPNNCHSPQHYLRIPIVSSIGGSGGTRLVPWRVVCVITRRHGRVCVPMIGKTREEIREIDLQAALKCVESGQMLDHSVIYPPAGKVSNHNNHDHRKIAIADTLTDPEHTLNLLALLGESKAANIVVEAIPSNPKGDGEPAISFITKALQWKMHVVSANKSPLAHCTDENKEIYWELQQLAQSKNVIYKHESAVMDGVPIFSLWQYTLPHVKLTSIRGCLNSTTTMILTRMEGKLDESMTSGESFNEALSAAKQMGIVEEDESLDVDGFDAAVKLRALLVVLTNESSDNNQTRVPTMDDIPRDSIRNVTRLDIRRAYKNGRKKYRLVASAKLIDDIPSANNEQTEASSAENNTPPKAHSSKIWEASVKLELLPPSDPLYNLTGTDSSVQFCTDVLGPVIVASSNPTLVDTAYGLFSDIIRVASESKPYDCHDISI